MITAPKDKISTAQATIAVSSVIIGAGILTITRDAAKIIGTPDIWISVILGGVLAIMIGFVIVKLSQRFPGKTFYQYSIVIAGRFIGWLLNMVLIIYFIIFAGFEARILAELIRTFLLLATPIEILIVTFIWVGAYLVVGGINPLVRAFELYFPVIVFVFAGILVLGFQHFDLSNLQPVLGQGIMPVLKGVKSTFLSYGGFEILLVITAFMKKPQKATKAMLVGLGIPIVFYIAISVIVTGVLTVDEMKTLTWPTASFVNSIEYPGGFVENFQIFFIIVWILAIFTTFSGAYYLAGLGLGQLFRKNINPFIYALLPFIYIISMIPQNLTGLFKMGDVIGFIWLAVAGLIPLVLLLVALIRKKGSWKKLNEE